uniref:Molybdopterin biosynthesis protein n=1 Tax=Pleonosporium borreri TaxID=2575635 RepID=A0A4D6WZA0_9FLOR|nr:Molybdopterin biosynthesis protein [Pleonosporium borreri]
MVKNIDKIKLSISEYNRYGRHLILKQIGIYGQYRLKRSKILIVGAGGLGCPAMIYLVASGIGYLGILDEDNIDISNLNRQILYNTKNINKSKSECAKIKLKEINSECKIIQHQLNLNINNALDIIKYYHIIVDASDNFKTRYIIDTACYKLHKVHIYGGINQFEGQLSVFNYQNNIRYSDLYPYALKLKDNKCYDNGVLGVITGTIGILQATETIKVILGIGQIIHKQILIYNLLNIYFYKLEITSKKYNNHIHINSTFNKNFHLLISELKFEYLKFTNNKKLLLIDIRENIEFNIKHINKSINIPLSKLKIKYTQKFIQSYNKKIIIVIYCNTIHRSIIASSQLKLYCIEHYILNK